MRHIPEDELHAYLDQGLSRTQCVEIESHLADCSACRASRDRIAALRDRTTALLARLAPPLRVPPAFDWLRRRAAVVASARRRRIRNTAWAASLVLAVGAGWTASSLVGPRGASEVRAASGERPAAAPRAPEPAPAPPPTRVASADAKGRPAPAPKAVEVRQPRRQPASVPVVPVSTAGAAAESADSAPAGVLAVLDAAPAASLAAPRPETAPGEQLHGNWRTLTWDAAESDAAHIGGLPVVKVQVQNGLQGSRPITVVAQQLSSGEVIQTIEGPAADVSQLLARRHADTTQPGDSLAHGLAGTMAMKVGDRMVAITGALPTDSLRAMIRRLNVEMRSK